ncbi:GNAT family N-acetyltransferase [Variovorax saccharolyticus]|uniref:GNAT family N-acetyltransferase n=1 Tax=Variovorax saccharolyticus TaxID=3053516 RepID=UPI0025758C18|nr:MULTISPECIES: GNAT family protein [unclassified Variovorax]MDM0017104.1 GNAT family protein [Variovorax sp. J22R187]MDM0023650.1 GNAT family protein [Variovorax sp. J31P216]
MPAADPADPVLPATVVLRDGRRVIVREIRADDKEALRAAVANMSADSRYSRFMTSIRELPDHMLEAATHPAPDKEFALVVLDADSAEESIVGGARYASAAGSDTCEFAIMVVDAWQHLGLAPRLMETLIAAAQAHGYRCIEGYVLSTNAAMRGLAKRLGFKESPCPGDATVRVVRLGLGVAGETGAA